jgi:hypothetical protein
MPFTESDGWGPAHLQLEPVGSKNFKVLRGFTYRAPEPGVPTYVVPGGGDTDLASVPFFLQWFIRSYGKHTLAAVLHDYLWRDRPDVSFKDSNRLFRVAMYELDVPFVRRWLMWAAVSLAGFAKAGIAYRVRAGLWVACIVALDVLTVLTIVNGGGTGRAIAAAALIVAAFSLLWPLPLVTAIGGPTLYLLAPSIVVILATLLLVLVVEGIVYWVARARRALWPKGSDALPPVPNPPFLKTDAPSPEPRSVVKVPDAEPEDLEHR